VVNFCYFNARPQMKPLLIVLISCIVVSVWAHAGLSTPSPRGESCTSTSDLAVCGLTAAPCGGKLFIRAYINYRVSLLISTIPDNYFDFHEIQRILYRRYRISRQHYTFNTVYYTKTIFSGVRSQNKSY